MMKRHSTVAGSSELVQKELPRRRADGLVRTTAATLLMAVVAMTSAAAQDPVRNAVINREYSIKAAFLYHFSSYVEWPPSAFPDEGEPFVIGLYQTDPFGAPLQTIAESKSVAGRPIAVRVVNSPDEVKRCQILFVPMSVSASQQTAALNAARSGTVLVVGESEHFVERGGDVQFYVEGNKVRFAFNAEITKSDDLKVSSKLLSLARIIPAP